MTQRVVDEGPLSEFVTKMKDVFRRRLAAEGVADKHALEREMKGLMQEYLGRDAWDAAAAAEERAAGVPRGTSRDQICPTHRASSQPHEAEVRDGKLLAAGRETD
jgi:hypothetical protein